MKKHIVVTLVLIITGAPALNSQKVLTLKECCDKAMAANALAGESDTYNNISLLRDKNLSAGWLPSLDASGSIVYNSSVIDISNSLGSLPVPPGSFKPLPREQYKITVDINQLIYDGGAIRRARAVEKADLRVNTKQAESDQYKLRAQVTGYYFSILLLGRQKELIENYLELLDKRIRAMQSALANGTIIKTDIDVLRSETIKLGQHVKEIDIKRASLLDILSGITGVEIDPSTTFILPPLPADLPCELARPELQLFDLRKEQLAAGMNLINSRRMPRAYGFASLGYGNPPGNNFFRDEFAPFYVAGAGIKWNIFDWNKARNEKQALALQQEIIDGRKTDLADNLQRMLEAKKAEIKSLEALIESDKELIAMRKRITATAESRYENGTITATGYLDEMNSEREALINFEIHRINLSMAGIEYMNISGKELE
jgi:outer membrane protein TolC